MSKPGDRAEWKGVNRTHHGIITESENGDLYVTMESGHSFPLPSLLQASSFICQSSNGSPTTTTSGCLVDATSAPDAVM